MTPDLLPEKMAKRISISESGCWEWTAGLNGCGYGKVWWQSRHYLTHRIAYELLVGTIPDGLQIDHLCRVRHCCNPEHLEPVTSGENQRRSPFVLRITEYARRRSLATHCKHGHEFTPENTRHCRGARVCVTCKRRRDRERRKALKASA